jgi:microcystin-dependent protein
MGISSGIGAVGFMPVGVVVPFAGSTSPAGWFLCFGQAISRTTYAGLFATIGTTYGSGDGSTTFTLPDLRGRVVAGEDDMGGTAASRLTSGGSGITGTTLGATGGTETHTLTTAQLASHNHTQDSHNHTQNSHNHTQDAHGHYLVNAGSLYMGSPEAGTGDYVRSIFTRTGADSYATSWQADQRVATNQATTATNIAVTATNQAAGGGTAHLNTQPTIVLNYIIKAA